MPDFTIRSDHVDVEQIMRQIRLRIKEKRGRDYTEDEVRTLADAKLESFLSPRAVRSELVEHYRRQRPAAPLPPTPVPDLFQFEDDTIYVSHRLPLLQWVRRALSPLLKLFFNPNPMIEALHRQAKMNAFVAQRFAEVSDRFLTRDELDGLNFEVLNNMVLELTRLDLEVKNLKMQIASMDARQQFNERRARASASPLVSLPASPAAVGDAPDQNLGDAGARTRRRRRRRSRKRPGVGGADDQPGASANGEDVQPESAAPSVDTTVTETEGGSHAASSSDPGTEP